MWSRSSFGHGKVNVKFKLSMVIFSGKVDVTVTWRHKSWSPKVLQHILLLDDPDEFLSNWLKSKQLIDWGKIVKESPFEFDNGYVSYDSTRQDKDLNFLTPRLSERTRDFVEISISGLNYSFFDINLNFIYTQILIKLKNNYFDFQKSTFTIRPVLIRKISVNLKWKSFLLV